MQRIRSEILRQAKLKATVSRSVILGFFLRSEHAVSQADLENQFSNQIDRVTIYRTLKAFVQRGIIHKVPDNDGLLRYALCEIGCTPAHHHHDHVHFKCTECGQTDCLPDVTIPGIILPNGFRAMDVNFLVEGVCSECQ